MRTIAQTQHVKEWKNGEVWGAALNLHCSLKFITDALYQQLVLDKPVGPVEVNPDEIAGAIRLLERLVEDAHTLHLAVGELEARFPLD